MTLSWGWAFPLFTGHSEVLIRRETEGRGGKREAKEGKHARKGDRTAEGRSVADSPRIPQDRSQQWRELPCGKDTAGRKDVNRRRWRKMQAGGETSEPLCGQECLGSKTTWVRWPMTYKCACSPQINITFDYPYQSKMVSLDTNPREHSNYLFTHWQARFKSKHLILSHPRVLTSHHLTFPCFPNGSHFISLVLRAASQHIHASNL